MSTDRFSFDLPDKEEPTQPTDPAPVSHKGMIPDAPGAEREWPVNVDAFIQWSDADIVERLDKAMQPDKLYRVRMLDTGVWCQTRGRNWLALIHSGAYEFEDKLCEIERVNITIHVETAQEAIRELFRWASQWLSLTEPLKLNDYIDRLEFPPVGPDPPYWDGSEDIITLGD